MSRARDLADRVLHNRTHEDTDGGRESIVTFKGEQSGGEISTLAQIQASHDGSADDQKSDLIFRTNDGSDGTSPTEVLRTNSAGNLLITSSDQFGLTLNTTDSNGGFIALKTSGTAKGYIGTSHHLVSGGSPSEDDITIRAEGKLQFAIGATEELRLDSDGLKFNGDTAAANALNDYEEGGWLPSFSFSGGSVGYSYRSGQYTKIGRKVFVTANMILNSASSPSGAVSIVALPFTTGSDSDSTINEGYVSGGSFSLVRNLTSQSPNIRAYIPQNGTAISLTNNHTGQGHVAFDASLLGSSTLIYLSATYFAAA
jgi:hypothetical protein